MCYASRHARILCLVLLAFCVAGSASAERVTYYPDEFTMGDFREWNEPMSGSLFFGMAIMAEIRQIMLDHGDDPRAYLVWVDALREMGTRPLLSEKFSYGSSSKTVAEYVIEVVVLSMDEEKRGLWLSFTKRRR